MSKYTQHIALFFLSVFVLFLIADGAQKGAKLYYSNAPGWHVTCQKKRQAVQTNLSVKSPLTKAKTPSEDQPNIIFFNCSTALNLLPASNSFFLNPERDKHIFRNQSTAPVLPIFVFQEPDPPRFV